MKDILIKHFSKRGIIYNEDMLKQLVKYKDMLVEWNEKFNLTTITDDEGIAVKHFVDSLTILDMVKGRKNLADVGTGAGFPGIPLKIAGFTGEVVLMDSLGKRVDFLEAVISELGLSGCQAIHIRAEDAGRGELRETFDVVTARAVANLPVLCEYCLPLVRKGGIFIAMKGPETGEEIRISKNSIEKLGGRLKKTEKLMLDDYERTIVIIEKIKNTPGIYPRKAGTPKKRPL